MKTKMGKTLKISLDLRITIMCLLVVLQIEKSYSITTLSNFKIVNTRKTLFRKIWSRNVEVYSGALRRSTELCYCTISIFNVHS